MDFEDCLKTMAREGGSDLYLTTGAPPSAKFNGELRPLSSDALPPGRKRSGDAERDRADVLKDVLQRAERFGDGRFRRALREDDVGEHLNRSLSAS